MADLTDNDRLVVATLVASMVSGTHIGTTAVLDLYDEMLREVSVRRHDAELGRKQIGTGPGTGGG